MNASSHRLCSGSCVDALHLPMRNIDAFFKQFSTEISNSLIMVYALPTDITDPIQWRPREFNVKADRLCNQALNTRSNFAFIEGDITAYGTQDMQWEAFSDGGCRGERIFAFVWIIYAVWVTGATRHLFTIAFGYDVVEGDHSSFATELWGLERAVVILDAIIATNRAR